HCAAGLITAGPQPLSSWLVQSACPANKSFICFIADGRFRYSITNYKNIHEGSPAQHANPTNNI
ncbi:hypothetical protein N9329_05460, partial [Gammaproteobacteria bacterium]|nr:hypothetical protein [Gammaproteobacteria bacterium]